jgi:hypothetical protein
MITSDYNVLTMTQKAEILWGEGKFIEAVELNDFDVSLYYLNDQYFEIFYSVENSRVEKVSQVEDPQRLELYKQN